MGTGPAKLIVWSDRYSVGIARLDAQHQRLIDLTNDLHAAMSTGQGNSVMAEILDGLAAYAVSHFAVEEALMAKFGYPGYEEHKAEHERLNVQVKQLQEKLRNDRYTIETELATFMRRWLIGHIAYLDKKYTAHLNAAGVT